MAGQSIFWSFLVAVMLFSIGGMFSLYEGVHKLRRPNRCGNGGGRVGVAVVAEGVSMRACLQEVGGSPGGAVALVSETAGRLN